MLRRRAQDAVTRQPDQVAVVHLGFLNLAFGMAPLSIDQWLVWAAMGSVR